MKEVTLNLDDRYLLDECVQFDLNTVEKDKYVLSRDLVGAGAPDEIVLAAAIERHLILITGDKRLALHAILHNQKVVFQHHKTKHRVIIEPKLLEYYDPISKTLFDKDEIIIP